MAIKPPGPGAAARARSKLHGELGDVDTGTRPCTVDARSIMIPGRVPGRDLRLWRPLAERPATSAAAAAAEAPAAVGSEQDVTNGRKLLSMDHSWRRVRSSDGHSLL